jgi:serine protease Do
MSLFALVRRQKLLSATLVLFTLSIGILIGTLLDSGVHAQRGSAAAPDAALLTIPAATRLSSAFTRMARQLEPSVVNITSIYGPQPQQMQGRMRRQQPSPDDDGSDLFRRFFGQDPNGDDPGGRGGRSTGSGVIVDRNGYILTNWHVVEDAARIQVKFNGDPNQYNARVVGADPETDLAVLHLDNVHQLTPAKIGNSDAVEVGDWAVAIGSPFGLEATVTAGIISAKGREIGGSDHQLQRFLQTDAAINPGNSGGPLLNIMGEVIGINTAIETETGGSQGVGFALPINLAVNVYNQIVRTGHVSRGSIGVSFPVEQKPELLRAWGAPAGGVFVTEVEPDGPAAKAGIKPEDIIIQFNGRPVRDGDDLVTRVSATPAGSQATLKVLRGNKNLTFALKVGERADVWAKSLRVPRYTPQQPAQRPQPASPGRFGIDVRNLTQGDRERISYTDRDGVLVTNVEPASFADDIGLLSRDIIVSINRQPVRSVDDIQRIERGFKPGDAVAFHVVRPLRRVRPGSGVRRVDIEWQSAFLAGALPTP